VVTTDEMNTMSPRPRVRIEGSTWRHSWCGPSACVATTRWSSSASVSATALPREAMPALQTRMSMPSNAAATSWARRSQSTGSATEPWNIAARPPLASMPATVSRAASASRW